MLPRANKRPSASAKSFAFASVSRIMAARRPDRRGNRARGNCSGRRARSGRSGTAARGSTSASRRSPAGRHGRGRRDRVRARIRDRSDVEEAFLPAAGRGSAGTADAGPPAGLDHCARRGGDDPRTEAEAPTPEAEVDPGDVHADSVEFEQRRLPVGDELGAGHPGPHARTVTRTVTGTEPLLGQQRVLGKQRLLLVGEQRLLILGQQRLELRRLIRRASARGVAELRERSKGGADRVRVRADRAARGAVRIAIVV
jgi:hypothetical protein